ncbi:MAG: T9SS type A sorting domain-containing protein [Janthinobacterium lividum]
MHTFFTKRACFAATKAGLGALVLLLVSFAGFGQASYTWQPVANSASWVAPDNWRPARTAPAATDILVFDGTITRNAVVTIDFAASQTVGQLVFSNGVSAALSTDANRTLAIGALPPAVGFVLEAGALVQVVGTQGSNSALTIQLAANVKAAVAGRLEFSGSMNSTTGSPHVLTSGTAGAVEFASGGYFLSGYRFSGNPFGTLKSSSGTVVFRSGATFEQGSGASPFGDQTAFAVAVFDPGSLFLFTTSSGSVGVSNRTFGHLTINANRTAPVASFGDNTLTIRNDLTVAAGTHTFNVRNVELQGNIVLSGGNLALVSVGANSTAQTTTLTLNGSAPQTITGTGTVTMGPNVSLTLNNAAGLALQRPLQVNATLTLAQGLLTTTAANSLTLAALATTSGGSATSFVNGPLGRALATANAATDLFFPIGSGTAYRPLTLRAEQTDANATTYTAQQFNRAPAARAYPTAAGGLQRVSSVRYFAVTNGSAANFTQGTVTLNYSDDDQVDAPAKLRIAKSDNAGNWLDLGGTGTGAPVGSITSTVPFTSFSDFVLASTEATGGPGNNPLPVSLIRFTAHREAAGVRLRWTTASERNNRHFEVQRSADGHAFAVLQRVPGHGNSTTAQEYAALDDANPASGVLYYRLRQVDADGTGTYLPVAAVQAAAVAASVFPNPAHDRLYFQAPAGSTYRVLNLLGQPLLTGQAATGGPHALDLASVVAGAYYLEVIGAAGREQYRFFKR